MDQMLVNLHRSIVDKEETVEVDLRELAKALRRYREKLRPKVEALQPLGERRTQLERHLTVMHHRTQLLNLVKSVVEPKMLSLTTSTSLPPNSSIGDMNESDFDDLKSTLIVCVDLSRHLPDGDDVVAAFEQAVQVLSVQVDRLFLQHFDERRGEGTTGAEGTQAVRRGLELVSLLEQASSAKNMASVQGPMMGSRTRTKEHYIQKYLAIVTVDYRSLFEDAAYRGRLDTLPSRLDWLLRTVAAFDHRHRLTLPGDWVPEAFERLIRHGCCLVSDDLQFNLLPALSRKTGQIQKSQRQNQLQEQPIMQALKATMAMERKLRQLLPLNGRTDARGMRGDDEDDDEEGREGKDVRLMSKAFDLVVYDVIDAQADRLHRYIQSLIDDQKSGNSKMKRSRGTEASTTVFVVDGYVANVSDLFARVEESMRDLQAMLSPDSSDAYLGTEHGRHAIDSKIGKPTAAFGTSMDAALQTYVEDYLFRTLARSALQMSKREAREDADNRRHLLLSLLNTLGQVALRRAQWTRPLGPPPVALQMALAAVGKQIISKLLDSQRKKDDAHDYDEDGVLDKKKSHKDGGRRRELDANFVVRVGDDTIQRLQNATHQRELSEALVRRQCALWLRHIAGRTWTTQQALEARLRLTTDIAALTRQTEDKLVVEHVLAPVDRWLNVLMAPSADLPALVDLYLLQTGEGSMVEFVRTMRVRSDHVDIQDALRKAFAAKVPPPPSSSTSKKDFS